jgi:hypothetical protein
VSAALPTYAGGHLGALVAPLVDGQLRPTTADRAWAHVLRCGSCADSVRRQTWVKNQLLLTSGAAPPPSLADRLCALPESLGVSGPCESAAHLGWSSGSRSRAAAAAAAGVGGLSAAAFVVASMVGLPAVGGSVPVEAAIDQSTASPRAPGAAIVDVLTLDRQRRVGLP